MKKFKEFYAGYSNWCKEGREKKYGAFLYLMLLLAWLPTIIYLCYLYYDTGQSIGYNEKAAADLNNAYKESVEKSADR